MISWDRHGESVVILLSPRQIRWLRAQLGDFRTRVENTLATPECDPVVAAVFAEFGADRAAQIAQARSLTAVVLGDLPSSGGVVEIRGDVKRAAWIWTLQDLRIAITTRLGARAARTTASLVGIDAPGDLRHWLARIVDALAHA